MNVIFLLLGLAVSSRLMNENHQQILPVPQTISIPNSNETITILIPGFVDQPNT